MFNFFRKNKKVLVAVAWPYVNGDIHIGHLAGYLLPADIFARFNRLIGNEVLMVSGSDCFGTPITLEADRRGVKPQDIVQEYHEKNKKLFLETLKLSFDLYTKTDTRNHAQVVQDIFVTLAKRGLIFKNTTNQYYSESEKRFLPDRYVEGTCPRCGYESARSDQCDKCGTIFEQGEVLKPKSKLTNAPVTLKPSEHYFLDWPKLEPMLKKYVENNKNNWRQWVYKETAHWLKEGLKPRPITRDLDWGIEIPINRLPEELKIKGAENKRIYVWFDAVIGYLSASIEWNKERYKDFWYDKRALHAYFMGKDNLVFHTLFWPGELYGYDKKIHLPNLLLVNQFLNLEGRKFSKSRGVTIDSEYMVKTYGLDPVRFYLASIMPESADANFTWDDFVSKTNDILIGNFGNFVNRTLTLSRGLSISNKSPKTRVRAEIETAFKNATEQLQKGEFRKYIDTFLKLSDFGNKYMSSHEPWSLKKSDPKKFIEVMRNALFMLQALNFLCAPLLPETSEKISEMLGTSSIKKWPANNIISYIKKSLSRVTIQEVKPLYTKLESEIISLEREKIKT